MALNTFFGSIFPLLQLLYFNIWTLVALKQIGQSQRKRKREIKENESTQEEEEEEDEEEEEGMWREEVLMGRDDEVDDDIEEWEQRDCSRRIGDLAAEKISLPVLSKSTYTKYP